MSSHQSSSRRRQNDAARYRVERNHARALASAQAAVIVELRTELLRMRLEGVLRRFDDFDRFIGVENVIDEFGRPSWSTVDREVRALLDRRPELAAPSPDVGGRAIA